MSICVRCYIFGQVQGVFFRASTLEQAQMLGIVGHAQNMGNGCVEVLACGDELAIDALKRWLQHGPPSAEVTEVECSEVDMEPTRGFTTL